MAEDMTAPEPLAALLHEAAERLDSAARSDDRCGYFATADDARALASRLRAAARVAGEPVAWKYKLATSFIDGEYCYWTERVSIGQPDVPAGSVRNLTPLYTHPAPARPGEVTDEERIDALGALVAATENGAHLHDMTPDWSVVLVHDGEVEAQGATIRDCLDVLALGARKVAAALRAAPGGSDR